MCYHYIRNEKSRKLFPRIMGLKSSEFENQIKSYIKNYQIISPSNAINFSYGDFDLKDKKTGLLLTVDDGLSDHFKTAKFLANNGISAIFFIPTCILKDNLPANPIIIHYCIAEFGLPAFLNEYNKIMIKFGKNFQNFIINYNSEIHNPFEIIDKIKNTIKYVLEPNTSRKILLEIYEKTLQNKYPECMQLMHLTQEQIFEMLEMGHSIGTHTHSHISVGSASLTKNEFYNEIISPKHYLEKVFGTNIDIMSYPFGAKADCLSSKELILQTNSYKLVFTVSAHLNTKLTPPLELGRYMPTGTDTINSLNKKMNDIIYGKDDI